MQTEEALDQLDHAWAVFDGEGRLRARSSAFAALLGCGAPSDLIGASYAELLERWLEVLEWRNDEERTAFREQCLAQRFAPCSSFEVSTRSGLCLRVTERRTEHGWRTSTIIDRTADARALAELRTQLQACSAASAAKTEFLCSMSHELRTPLSSVLGFAQLMQRDVKEPLPARHVARVAQILQGGEHLVHVIDDLLDLSRIDAGRVTVSCERIDVARLLEQLRAALEPLAQSAGVALWLEPPQQAGWVTADPARAMQILMNFGSNAIKYNRPGGTVRLAASAPVPGRIRATVTDSGVGVPDERQGRLFEPFYRAGQERGAIPGTGMGLAISKRLAELMQGEVGFSSIWMQGSEFWLELPAVAAAS